MKEIKYLPRWRVWVFYAAIALAILFALPPGLQDTRNGFTLEIILLAAAAVMRFARFRCPYCGSLLRVLPKTGAGEELNISCCANCGGPYACQ